MLIVVNVFNLVDVVVILVDVAVDVDVAAVGGVVIVCCYRCFVVAVVLLLSLLFCHRC